MKRKGEECEWSYEKIFLANPIPQWIEEPGTGRILVVNDAALALCGYSREELSRLSERLALEPTGEAILDPARSVGSEPFHGSGLSKEYIDLDGDDVLLVTALPSSQRGEGGQHRHEETLADVALPSHTNTRIDRLVRWFRHKVKEHRDVNDSLHKGNQALTEMNRELVTLSVAADTARDRAEQAVRARDEIIATVAHDLKNPLHTIALTLDLLNEIPHTEAEHKRRLELIGDIVNRITRLVSGLLDMARIEAGEAIHVSPRPVRPQLLVDEALAVINPQAQAKGVQLAVEIDSSGPRVIADADRIQQVFWNLLGNALKFTPSGGTVGIEATLVEEKMRFDVSDSGPGIAEADRERLFDPFWQEKRTKRLGTGLGLPIAKAIVEEHCGSIWVSNYGPSGATFSFTLPTEPEENQPQ